LILSWWFTAFKSSTNQVGTQLIDWLRRSSCDRIDDYKYIILFVIHLRLISNNKIFVYIFKPFKRLESKCAIDNAKAHAHIDKDRGDLMQRSLSVAISQSLTCLRLAPSYISMVMAMLLDFPLILDVDLLVLEIRTNDIRLLLSGSFCWMSPLVYDNH